MTETQWAAVDRLATSGLTGFGALAKVRLGWVSLFFAA
jgi:hypothetical protein